MFDVCRLLRRLFLLLLPALLTSVVAAQGPPTTQISDTVYRADGTPAGGTLLISWPEFTTAGGQAVAAGNTSVTLGAGGALSVALVSNANATPANTVYVVVYQLNDGSAKTEYWIVPTTSPTTLAVVRTTLGATSSVSQMATELYVNNALAAKANDAAVVHLGGSETITGVKQFVAPPSLPSPVGANDAANKQYVDNAVGNVGSGSYLSTTGGTMTGALTLSGDPVAANQASTKHYVDTGIASKADLISGLVPTSELGTGTAGNGVCLHGDSTWGGCGGNGNGNVNSVFGRSGSISAQAGDYTVSQVTGAAPLAGPAFTGTPTAPTPANGDSSTAIATTAFVKNQAYASLVSGLVPPTELGTGTASSSTCLLGNGTYGACAILDINGNFPGNANTATQLAQTPTQCNGSFATGVQANGNANCSTADVIQLAETSQSQGIPNYGIFWFDATCHCPKVIDNNGQAVQLGLLNVFNSDGNTLEERNGPTPQEFRIYGTYGDSSDYERLRIGWDATDGYYFIGPDYAGSSSYAARGLGVRLADSSGNSSLRWVFDTAFNLHPWSNNTYNIGTPTQQVKNVYVGTGVVFSSGLSLTGVHGTTGTALEAGTVGTTAGAEFCNDGNGNATDQGCPVANVSSVFGRAGTITAQTGDYSVAQVTGAAPLASPAFTGTPVAPTPSASDSSTKIATTAWVNAQGYGTSSGNVSGPGSSTVGDVATYSVTNGKTIQDPGVALASLAPLASPAFTGTPTGPTPASSDNSTKLATTAYVQAQGIGMPSSTVGQVPVSTGTGTTYAAKDKDCYSPTDFGATQTTDLGAAWASIYTAKGNDACVTLALMDATHAPGGGSVTAGQWIMTSNPFAGLSSSNHVRVVTGGGPVQIVTNVPFQFPSGGWEWDGSANPGNSSDQGLRIVACHTETVNSSNVIVPGGCTANGVAMTDWMLASSGATVASQALFWTPPSSAVSAFTATVGSKNVTAITAATAPNTTQYISNVAPLTATTATASGSGSTVTLTAVAPTTWSSKFFTGALIYVTGCATAGYNNSAQGSSFAIASGSSGSSATITYSNTTTGTGTGCVVQVYEKVPITSAVGGMFVAGSCREPITGATSNTLTLQANWQSGCNVSGSATIYWPNINAVLMDSTLGNSVDNNSFGRYATEIAVDLEGLPYATAYYCANCEENSDVNHLNVTASAGIFGAGDLPIAACYLFDASFGMQIGPGNQYVDKLGNCAQGSGIVLGSAGAGTAVDNLQGPYGLVLESWSPITANQRGGPQGWVTSGSVTVNGPNGKMEAGIVCDGCLGTHIAKSHLERFIHAGVWLGPVNPTKGVFVVGPSTSSAPANAALVLMDTNATGGNCVDGGSTDVVNNYFWEDLANSVNSGLSSSGGGVMGSGTGLGALSHYCQGAIGANGGVLASTLQDTTGTTVATLAPNAITLSGTPTAPTPSTSDSSTKIATTAYVQAQAYAPLASPSLTGTPTAPTQTADTNSAAIATTAYVDGGYLTTWMDWGSGASASSPVPFNSSTGHCNLFGILLKQAVKTSQISFEVITADNTSNTYDVGLYAGVSGSSDSLILNTGAVAGSTYYTTASTWTTIPWVQGTKTLPPGRYYLALYANEASAPATIISNNSGDATFYHLSSFSITPASGGLPSSITGPSDVLGFSAAPHFILH